MVAICHSLNMLNVRSTTTLYIYIYTYINISSRFSSNKFINFLQNALPRHPYLNIAVSKIRKNIYRSNMQLTFELYSHFRGLLVLYAK